MVRPMFALVCWLCQAWPAVPGVVTPYSLDAEQLQITAVGPAVMENASLPLPEALLYRAPQSSTKTSVGERWRLGEGRELTLYLTPSPAQCAPLMKMRF